MTNHDVGERDARRGAKASQAYAALFVFLIAASVHVSGCSLIGFTVGSALDATSHPAPRYVATGEIRRFRPGDALELHMRDSTRVSGTYDGSARLDADAYGARYAEWQTSNSDAAGLPALGQSVRLDSKTYIFDARGLDHLLGFTHLGVLVDDRRLGEVEVLYTDIRRMEAEGQGIVNGETLRALRRSGGLPLLTTLQVRTDDGLREVPLDDVAYVRAPGERNAAHQGLVIGLVADALIVATVAIVAGTNTGPFDTGCDTNLVGLAPEAVPDGLRRRALAEATLAAAEERVPRPAPRIAAVTTRSPSPLVAAAVE